MLHLRLLKEEHLKTVTDPLHRSQPWAAHRRSQTHCNGRNIDAPWRVAACHGSRSAACFRGGFQEFARYCLSGFCRDTAYIKLQAKLCREARALASWKGQGRELEVAVGRPCTGRSRGVRNVAGALRDKRGGRRRRRRVAARGAQECAGPWWWAMPLASIHEG